jgi:hypothetical protein
MPKWLNRLLNFYLDYSVSHLYLISDKAVVSGRPYLKPFLGSICLLLTHGEHEQLPFNLAKTLCMLMVILWWERVALSDTNFVSARNAPIDARVVSLATWCMLFVIFLVIGLREILPVFVTSHICPFLTNTWSAS